MLQDTSKTSIMVSKVNLLMGAFSVLGFLTYPIFATAKGEKIKKIYLIFPKF